MGGHVTASKKTPAHGTVQRYRLELKDQREGKGKGPCDRCRRANNDRAKASRANATARARRATMTIVDDVTPNGHIGADDTGADTSAPPAPEKGPMVTAVELDIAEIEEAMRVPFHRSLEALALASAREIDDPNTSATARGSARKQLFEVLRSLRTTKEGDDDSAVDAALKAGGFGLPLVP
jgi:hypothetical protein